MYKKLKPQGFQLVAVNMGDSAKTIKSYYKTGGFTFPTVMTSFDKGNISEKYNVSAYPSNFVIDAKGKVVFSCVGFDEAGIRKALAKLGVK